MGETSDKILQLRETLLTTLDWGAVDDWNNYDFDRLSQMISDKTTVLLSPMTLKRIFGKVKYDSKPSAHTLNALSQFLGYKDWRDYQSKVEHQNVETHLMPSSDEVNSSNKSGSKKRLGILLTLVSLSLLAAVWFFTSLSSEEVIDPQDYKFSFQKIGEGLPSSVVFSYDARKAPKQSTIEIQQNWDVGRRQIVHYTDSIHNSIYYYPGFYESKLVVNNQVVKEEDIFIPSGNWVTAIEQPETPVYIPLDKSIKENIIGIEPEELKSQGFFAQRDKVWTNYSLVKPFDAYFDDFTFEAKVKSAALGGSNPCQKIQSLLLFEGEAMIIPLSKEGCVADLELHVPNTNTQGKTSNLIPFGRATEEWTHLKVSSQNQNLKIFINDDIVREFQVEPTKSKWVGFRFRFQGTGWVKDVILNNESLL